MTTLLAALFEFALWTLFLLSALLTWRGLAILRRQRRINEFPAGEKHGSDTYWRLNRAHQNCLENLPIFGVLVLGGCALGEAQLAAIPLAVSAAKLVPLARIGQSLAHVSSGSAAAVTIRFSFFLAQVLAFAFMAASFMRVVL